MMIGNNDNGEDEDSGCGGDSGGNADAADEVMVVHGLRLEQRGGE